MDDMTEHTQWSLAEIARHDPERAQRIEGALRCMATIQAQEAAARKVVPMSSKQRKEK